MVDDLVDRRPEPTGPLDGIVVVDVSRMLPGAVLGRMLLDLGCRLIKVEEPETGDPLRFAPPLVDGIGAGFREFFAGAESVTFDVRGPQGASTLRKLARHADVVVESFRPGALDTWGAGPERLQAANPKLVVCSLSGFGAGGANASRIGHDLNFTALSGLLDLLPGSGVPRIQISDVTAGILACSAVLAALLQRSRTGSGARIEQPLAGGALPHLTWALADLAAGRPGLWDGILGGRCPAYRIYVCGDGLEIAVATLEPKFWGPFLEMLGIEGFEGLALDTGPEGLETAERIAEILLTRPRADWLRLAAQRELPVSAVHDLASAATDPAVWGAGLVEDRQLGPFLPSLSAPRDRTAPVLGKHTASVFREFGIDDAV